MDDLIRAAAGRGPAPPRPAATDDKPADAKRRAAALAGVPEEHAHRLQGDTGEELLTDAKRFVAETGISAPRTGMDGGVREHAMEREHTMDDLLRATQLERDRRIAGDAESFRQQRERP